VFEPVPHHRLPGVLKGFDVGIIPNRINEHTAGNDPIKLFDYLATGRPVVATPTAGTEPFAHLIGLAEGAAAFVDAVVQALRDAGDTDAVLRRIETARAHSWEARYALLQEYLVPLLALAGGDIHG
jgi:glycosyltransferase involved in cell wall biosynthesis